MSTHVQYCRTDTDRYLQLTVRKFRTDRHSCLRTVICGWRSVCFARTVILACGPLFAVDGPYVSHRPSFLLTVRIQSMHLIIAPGPTVDGPYISHGPSFLLTDRYLWLTVRTFRTDRHSYLQSEYRACISLSRQGQLLTVRTFRTDRHHCLRTVICGWRSVRLAQTVILAYRLSFTIHDPYVEV